MGLEPLGGLQIVGIVLGHRSEELCPALQLITIMIALASLRKELKKSHATRGCRSTGLACVLSDSFQLNSLSISLEYSSGAFSLRIQRREPGKRVRSKAPSRISYSKASSSTLPAGGNQIDAVVSARGVRAGEISLGPRAGVMGAGGAAVPQVDGLTGSAGRANWPGENA